MPSVRTASNDASGTFCGRRALPLPGLLSTTRFKLCHINGKHGYIQEPKRLLHFPRPTSDTTMDEETHSQDNNDSWMGNSQQQQQQHHQQQQSSIILPSNDDSIAMTPLAIFLFVLVSFAIFITFAVIVGPPLCNWWNQRAHVRNKKKQRRYATTERWLITKASSIWIYICVCGMCLCSFRFLFTEIVAYT